jgi:polyisoprenoid-binding protein YceI
MQSTQAHANIQPGNYDIDPQRTTIRFRTRHMFGLGPVRGTFALRSGAVSVTDPPDGSAIYAEIEAASFHTGNPQRDRTVLQRRHLDAARHPVIAFAAQGPQPERTGPVAGTIIGTLTVRGIERPVTLDISSAERTGADLAVTGSMHVDRYDFGLTAMRGLAGRYLDLELSAVCVARGTGQDGAGQDGAGQDGGRHHG